VPDAVRTAQEKNLDLVEVAPAAKPPVCRIMDYSKYKYDQGKKEREARRRQRTFQVKEIKVKPKIEEHDYLVKMNQLIKFVRSGHKVKVTMMFRGREMAHVELGRRILDRMIADAHGVGFTERIPMLEGRNMVMIISPK
jgi:translation initiation factor IF-3